MSSVVNAPTGPRAARRDVTLTGISESVYERAVDCFKRHSADEGGLFITNADVLESAAREALAGDFAIEKFRFFASKAWARWSKISLATFELLIGAVSAGASMDGLRYVGLVLTLLFPARDSVITVEELERMARVSAPPDMPTESLDELVTAMKGWGDPEGTGRLNRGDFLRLTAEMEALFEALQAEARAEELGEAIDSVVGDAQQ